jgi:hypothetical protein
MDAGADGIGGIHGGNHFFSGLYVQLFGNPFLKGGQKEIRQEQKRFFFFDDLYDIGITPLVRLSDGLKSGLAKLHANGIRLFRFYDFFNDPGAFTRNMGRPNKQDFPAVTVKAVNRLVVVIWLHSIYIPSQLAAKKDTGRI